MHLTLSHMTNFRLFQAERVCRRQFKFDENLKKILQKGRKVWKKVKILQKGRKVWKKVKILQKGRKVWKKEKFLVMSNFSFSHNVFKRLALQTHTTRTCVFWEKVLN